MISLKFSRSDSNYSYMVLKYVVKHNTRKRTLKLNLCEKQKSKYFFYLCQRTREDICDVSVGTEPGTGSTIVHQERRKLLHVLQKHIHKMKRVAHKRVTKNAPSMTISPMTKDHRMIHVLLVILDEI